MFLLCPCLCPRLSLDLLPVSSSPSTPCPGLSLACGPQVGVFNHWAQGFNGAALTLTCFQHLLLPDPGPSGALDSQGNKSGAVDVCEAWCRAQEWGLNLGRPWSPPLRSWVVLLLCASLAPSGGHEMLCILPCLDKFLTFQPGSPAPVGDSLGVGTLEGVRLSHLCRTE